MKGETLKYMPGSLIVTAADENKIEGMVDREPHASVPTRSDSNWSNLTPCNVIERNGDDFIAGVEEIE